MPEDRPIVEVKMPDALDLEKLEQANGLTNSFSIGPETLIRMPEETPKLTYRISHEVHYVVDSLEKARNIRDRLQSNDELHIYDRQKEDHFPVNPTRSDTRLTLNDSDRLF